MQDRRRDQLAAGALAVAAMLGAAACGAITEGGASQTLAPLPPPGQGVSITLATVAPALTAAPTLAPGETAPADDTNPASVVGRFLAAAATGNAAAGAELVVGDTEPATFDWAAATYASTVDVAGAGAWGTPQCTDPAGATVTCTWLQNDPNTSLVLVPDGTAWRVSHPLTVPPAGEPAVAGSGCVVGDLAVNMRGGPSKSWPRFVQVSPGTCGVTVFDVLVDDPDGPWRYIELDGQRGWIVDRVLNLQ
jgi:hypothetical protein